MFAIYAKRTNKLVFSGSLGQVVAWIKARRKPDRFSLWALPIVEQR